MCVMSCNVSAALSGRVRKHSACKGARIGCLKQAARLTRLGEYIIIYLSCMPYLRKERCHEGSVLIT